MTLEMYRLRLKGLKFVQHFISYSLKLNTIFASALIRAEVILITSLALSQQKQ